MTPRETPPGMPAVRTMTDPDLLSRAITVSRLGTRDFALDILDVSEARVRVWLSGERRLPMVVRALCIAIVRRPALISEILSSRNDDV
jgi:hypothetical protein